MTITLERLDVSGSPSEMGRQQGEHWRDRIQAFVQMRFDAVRGYVADRGRQDWERIFDAGAESFPIFEQWDPTGYAEQVGIAEGAGVDPLRLFTACNMTDMRDAVLLSAPEGQPLSKKVDEGCSSLLVPPSRSETGQPLAGQTWDLNPPDVEYVVAVHRKPTEGLDSWAITCTGCLSLMGMNETGLSVGTTNIKTYGARPGVGYLSILHRALRSADVEEAEEVVRTAPHAGAHTYWLADAERQVEYEASPLAQVLRSTDEGPIYRTNHCIAEVHRNKEGEVVSASTQARFARLGLLLRTPQSPMGLRQLFADREDGVNSINRYAEDDQGTATNAVFIASPAEKKAWACRGPADRGEWVELGF
jgi:isopenicillin-N N-acyltransferase-like protein